MDTREDRAWYTIEKKYGPAECECECEGTCELAFTLAGEIHHHKNLAEKRADEHHKYCPMARDLKSTFCVCSELEKAAADAKKQSEDCNCEGGDGYSERPFKCPSCRAKDDRECQRCKRLAPDCRCAPGKEQLV